MLSNKTNKSSLNPFIARYAFWKWRSKFCIFYKTSKFFNDFSRENHGRGGHEHVVCRRIFGGKLFFKMMSAGGRLYTLQENPHFWFQRSKLDHLMVLVHSYIMIHLFPKCVVNGEGAAHVFILRIFNRVLHFDWLHCTSIRRDQWSLLVTGTKAFLQINRWEELSSQVEAFIQCQVLSTVNMRKAFWVNKPAGIQCDQSTLQLNLPLIKDPFKQDMCVVRPGGYRTRVSRVSFRDFQQLSSVCSSDDRDPWGQVSSVPTTCLCASVHHTQLQTLDINLSATLHILHLLGRPYGWNRIIHHALKLVVPNDPRRSSPPDAEVEVTVCVGLLQHHWLPSKPQTLNLM